ncbi:hypothetical protein MKZ38_006701 [Zalerion maritima]|uniref:DUF924-domain-containing protein n=1 Tax=Zalerion maritima TaxID=339359 RepID=A0AAD5RIN3_9PEZI|nr:hypothetical protein MKZ38_006701 [Zalerion maritima]
MSSPLAEQLTPEFLQSVRDFWYEHITEEHQYVIPEMKQMMRWFTQSNEFDTACAAKFKPALELIQSVSPTPSDLIEAANPQSPLDWMSLIVLLDQFPRNIYRGPAAKIPFTIFDPLSSSITMTAISKGVDKDPSIRYRIAARNWFYVPLTHQEDLAFQDRCVEESKRIGTMMAEMDESNIPPEDAPGGKDARIMLKKMDEEVAQMMLKSSSEFSEKHRDIIKRFGRFPHRNGPLGRVTTPEEKKWLEEGGETFSRRAEPEETK